MKNQLEFIEEEHIYLVDGIIVPSITQIVAHKFPNRYKGISAETLNKAAAAGTAVHEAIERYIKDGTDSDLEEVRGFKFLQKCFGFEVVESELPVILYENDLPIAAGRLDLVLKQDGKLGGADIKRTAVLDKQYLYYQLNLYRIAYEQTFGKAWSFLKGIHLRGDIRKYVDIPINEQDAWDLIHDYFKEVK